MADFTELVVEDYLKTPEQRAAFINEAVAENDPAFLKVALGCVAKAVGMSEVAERSGLNRENLYRAFSDGGNPTLDTLIATLGGMGLKLEVAPK